MSAPKASKGKAGKGKAEPADAAAAPVSDGGDLKKALAAVAGAPAPRVQVLDRVCHVVFPRLPGLPSHLPQINYDLPLTKELSWGCAQYEERPEGGRDRPYTVRSPLAARAVPHWAHWLARRIATSHAPCFSCALTSALLFWTQGFNFPAALCKPQRTPLLLAQRAAQPFEYVIGYIVDDADTKEHELRHAQFGMDAAHRKRVHKAWEAMHKKDPGRANAVVQQLKRDECTQILHPAGSIPASA